MFIPMFDDGVDEEEGEEDYDYGENEGYKEYQTDEEAIVAIQQEGTKLSIEDSSYNGYLAVLLFMTHYPVRHTACGSGGCMRVLHMVVVPTLLLVATGLVQIMVLRFIWEGNDDAIDSFQNTLFTEDGADSLCWKVTDSVKSFAMFSNNTKDLLKEPGLISCIPDEMLLMYDLDLAADPNHNGYITMDSVVEMQASYTTATGRNNTDLTAAFNDAGRYLLDLDPGSKPIPKVVTNMEAPIPKAVTNTEASSLKDLSHSISHEVERSPWWTECSALQY